MLFPLTTRFLHQFILVFIALCLISCAHFTTNSPQGDWEHPVFVTDKAEIVQLMQRFATQVRWRFIGVDEQAERIELDYKSGSGVLRKVFLQLVQFKKGNQERTQVQLHVINKSKIFEFGHNKKVAGMVLAFLKQNVSTEKPYAWIPEYKASEQMSHPSFPAKPTSGNAQRIR